MPMTIIVNKINTTNIYGALTMPGTAKHLAQTIPFI